MPILFHLTSKLTCLLRKQVGRTERVKLCSSVLINCSVIVIVILVFVGMLYLELELLISGSLEGSLFTLAIFDLVVIVCAMLSFRCFPTQINF